MKNPYTNPILKACWEMGRDRILNGPNKRNCAFEHFDGEGGAKDQAWKAGCQAGKEEQANRN